MKKQSQNKAVTPQKDGEIKNKAFFMPETQSVVQAQDAEQAAKKAKVIKHK